MSGGYKRDAATVEAMREACIELKSEQKISYAEIGKGIERYLKDPSGRKTPEVSNQRMSEFMNGKGRSMPLVNLGFGEALWRWLNENYKDVLDRKLKGRVKVGKLAASTLVVELHERFEQTKPIHENRIERLHGRYRLYRSSHLDPDELVMVVEMTFGGDTGDPFGFRMVTTFDLSERETVTDVAVGDVVPFAESVMLIGSFEKRAAPVVAILRRFADMPNDSRTRRAEGVLLIGTEGDLPGAYPILIVRDESGFQPHVTTRQELRRDRLLANDVLPVLERGVVRWRTPIVVGAAEPPSPTKAKLTKNKQPRPKRSPAHEVGKKGSKEKRPT